MANYTILLIDYEPRSIERFRDPLVAAGYKVEIATDGVSGIETFHRINPDMVLVEAMIPKKHGFEVCQELKRTPHGRRTPVLITTGVYKGRKYRTQALHIYGCDEYIEKPIAPEQLLEIVGKFFAPGAAAASSKAVEPAPAPAERNVGQAPEPSGAQAATTPATVETPPPKNERGKPAPVPKSSAAGDTEDEIMARLDAILPSGMFGEQPAEPPPMAMVATIDLPDEIEAGLPDEIVDELPIELPTELPAEVETAAETGVDPFAQMRAELDAELGSFSAALALELAPAGDPLPEPMPSDQAVSPSVLEALPAPEEEVTIAPVPVSAPAVKAEMPGQLVSFDTKRSRKNKKAAKAGKETRQQVASVQTKPSPVAPTPVPPAPLAPPRATVPEIKLPKGTLVESALESSTARRGVPAWIWAVMGLAAIAGAYVFISRGGTPQGDPPPIAAERTETASNAPVETPTEAVANTQSSTAGADVAAPPVTIPPPAAAPASAKLVPEVKKPLPGDAKTAVAKKSPEAGPAAPQAVAPLKARIGSKAIEQWKPGQPAVPAPLDSDASVAGVEALPAVAVPAAATTIAAGTLVPLDEADGAPVNLQHKAPIYSLQARQMRLAGTVAMNVLVNQFGKVEQVVLVSGVPGADLNESAMRAAQGWTYRPATKQGVPVKVWKPEQVVFKP